MSWGNPQTHHRQCLGQVAKMGSNFFSRNWACPRWWFQHFGKLVEGNLGEFRPKLRSFIRVSYSRMAKHGGQRWWPNMVVFWCFPYPKSDPYPAHGVGQRIDTAWWTPVGLPKRASTRKHNLQAIQSDLSSSWFEVTKKPWNHKCHK